MAFAEDFPLSTDHYADIIGAQGENFVMPVQGIRMLSYLDAEGEQCWAFRVDGMPRTIPLIGLIELVKLELFERRTGSLEEDTDG